MKSRKDRMIDDEKRVMVPVQGQSTFEFIDYTEMNPGLSFLTYRYSSIYGNQRSITTRWAGWANDHKLSSGVLYTDFEDVE